MKKSAKRLRAIDLYSGIGGWSLGLKMSGIELVASYEWWSKANITNQKNNQHSATEIDIRQLHLEDLPKNIDVVVGSPPCTQFSYANRGGSGDIEDGLKDVAKFLAVVDYVRPRYWAMENVPRVAGIIEHEMRPGGRLKNFVHLAPAIRVVDTCEWGVPQRRQRCIAGNFDFNILMSYREFTKTRMLGDVVRSLAADVVTDPIYGIEVPSGELKDHIIEEFLSPEEERMNREMKSFHPVYNNMAFPDPLNRTARTITATCTRVSRESIVIAAPEQKKRFRRLTVRERGCLQSFPINYQFYGDSYSQKLKMIGNAVPPLFTFYIAQAMLGVKPENLINPPEGISAFAAPTESPPRTLPDTAGSSFTRTRRFRSAIPHLRFKSGVRFELSNSFDKDKPKWAVRFFFGNSKNISELQLDDGLGKELRANARLKSHRRNLQTSLSHVENIIASTDAKLLQKVWTHHAGHRLHPYDIVDVLGQAASEIILQLSSAKDIAQLIVGNVLQKSGNPQGTEKVLKNSVAVLAGFLIGTAANAQFLKDRFAN